MPFGLKNAPLVYQQMLDNCLWGFVRLPPELEAEVEPEVMSALGLDPARPGEVDEARDPRSTPGRTVFEMNLPAPKRLGPVLGRSSYIDDVAGGGETWDEMVEMLDRLMYRLRYWRISVNLLKSSFGKRSIDYLSHRVDRFGIKATPKIAKELDQLPFPPNLKALQSFLGSINYYGKFIEDHATIASRRLRS
ncbi:hypothetical protein ATCC90586_011704 [Pythium insidiosum]|nr:hypothetical protein ATCC90586_011704 [Pythium insidiosum]